MFDTIIEIEAGLTSLKAKYQQSVGQLKIYEQQKIDKTAALESAQADIKMFTQTQIVLSKMADFARSKLNRRITETGTAGLRSIFQDPEMEFAIATNAPGETPAARWQISGICDGHKYFSEPEENCAGGELDTESLAIRMAVMESTRPRTEGPILFDEPAKMVSKLGGSIERLSKFIKAYLEKTGRQGIVITHHEPMGEIADLVQGVVKENGVSRVMSGEEYYARKKAQS